MFEDPNLHKYKTGSHDLLGTLKKRWSNKEHRFVSSVLTYSCDVSRHDRKVQDSDCSKSLGAAVLISTQ